MAASRRSLCSHYKDVSVANLAVGQPNGLNLKYKIDQIFIKDKIFI